MIRFMVSICVILLVEMGVGITVASVMITLFFQFSWRTAKQQDTP